MPIAATNEAAASYGRLLKERDHIVARATNGRDSSTRLLAAAHLPRLMKKR
jgi:hypothetical protein